MRRRFVIIDPSEITEHSHNFAYNQGLLRAAEAEGFETVLLTNEADTASHPGAAHRKIYPHTIYQHDRIVVGHVRKPPAILERPYYALGARQVALSRWLDEIKREENAATVGVLKAVPALIDIGRHATFGAALAALRKLNAKKPPFNADVFAERTAEALLKLRLGPGDKLLVHTASYGLIESFFEVTGKLFPNHFFDCDAYFVFHMSLRAPDSSTYLDRYYSFSNPESIRRRMRHGMPFARCHILATSEPLRQEMIPHFGSDIRLWHHLCPEHLFDGRTGQTRTLNNANAPDFVVGLRETDLTEANVDALCDVAKILADTDVRWRIGARNRNSLNERAARFLAMSENATIVGTSSDDDFLSFLQNLNALILPYQPEIYERRLSGVFFDALTLGVPCIVPAETTLADAAKPGIVGVYDDLTDIPRLVEAMRSALHLRPDAIREAVRAESERQSAIVFRNPLKTDLADGQTPTINVAKAVKVAVQLVPSWPRCGSSLAFARQVDELMEAGYLTLQVLLSEAPLGKPRDAPWVFKLLKENSSISRGHIQRISSPGQLSNLKLRFSKSYRQADALSQLMQRVADGAVNDRSFMRLARRAEVVLVNHVFNWQWAKQLPAKRRVLDMHDIQSYHLSARGATNARTGAPESFANMFATESKIWSEADHVFCVSEQEHKVVKTYNQRSSLLVPYPSPKVLKPVSNSEYHDFVRRNALHESFLYEQTFECMILGDSHPGNVDSILWFIKEVFIPHFSGTDTRLVIAGRAGPRVYEHEWTRRPHTFFTDFLDSVDVLRARSRVSILPDQSGEGISIKFLDTVAASHPFVASPIALRGLWFDTSAYKAPADAAQFAGDLQSLLTQPTALAGRKALAEQLCKLATDSTLFREGFRSAVPSA